MNATERLLKSRSGELCPADWQPTKKHLVAHIWMRIFKQIISEISALSRLLTFARSKILFGFPEEKADSTECYRRRDPFGNMQAKTVQQHHQSQYQN